MASSLKKKMNNNFAILIFLNSSLRPYKRNLRLKKGITTMFNQPKKKIGSYWKAFAIFPSDEKGFISSFTIKRDIAKY